MPERDYPTNPLTSERTGPLEWEPLGKFEDARLREAPELGTREKHAWGWLIGKRCAGLKEEWTADPEDVREAMQSGQWDEVTETTFRWVASGESMLMIPHWYERCAISIHDMARARMRVLKEPDSWAWLLNVWAKDPSEPKPWVGMWGREADYAGGECIVKGREPW